MKEITDETLEKVLYNKKKPFSELKELIIAIQESNSKEIILTEDEAVSEIINEDFIDDRVEEVFEEAKSVEKEIYIPQRVENLQIRGLPLSDALAAFLTQNNIRLFADLRKISGKLLNKILVVSVKPFPELRHYILAFQEGFDDQIRTITVERENQQEDFSPDDKNSAPPTSGIEKILPRTIFIPLPARKWAISHLPLSSLLVGRLEESRYVKLGNLNALKYSQFLREGIFEKKDVMNLYVFLAQLQSEKTFPSIERLVLKAIHKTEQSTELPSTMYQVRHPNLKRFVEQSAKPLSTEQSGQTLNSNESDLDFTKDADKSKAIQTPASLRSLPIEHLAPSDELKAAFKKAKLLFVGQLDGAGYIEVKETLKLSEENFEELLKLIAFANKHSRYTTFKSGFDNIQKAAQRRREFDEAERKNAAEKTGESAERKAVSPAKIVDQAKKIAAPDKFLTPLFGYQKFALPVSLQKIPISDFALTIKTAEILRNLYIELIGDLEKISFDDFIKARFCTAKEKTEFRQFLSRLENFESNLVNVDNEESNVVLKQFDTAELLKFINGFASKLSALDKEIISDRFGGSNYEEILTFEEIARKNSIARERAYQIYLRTLNKLKDDLPKEATGAAEMLRSECVAAICPLTEKFLISLIDKDYELFHFPVAFYIRLLNAVFQEIPILPKIENRKTNLSASAKKLEQQIKLFLGSHELPVSLPDVFNQMTMYAADKGNLEVDFFETIQSVKFSLIATDKPRELFIELRLNNLMDDFRSADFQHI